MKSFRPQKPEKDVISIRLDTKIIEQLDKLSASVDISRNEFIVQCIEYALKNMDEK